EHAESRREKADVGRPLHGDGRGRRARRRPANAAKTQIESPFMKYLAILKDSLLEAIDTKVFYVMAGLSLLVTLLTATLSFKPRPMGKLMQIMAAPMQADDIKQLRPDQLMMLAMGTGKYEVKSSEPRDGGPEGPGSPYRVL